MSSFKIFMGDAGSLVLGFILVVSGIFLIQSAQGTSNISITLAIVIGVLFLPVADSLRVYRRRIKTGYSPFRADKTHLHHLVLFLGFKHKRASSLIILSSMLLVVFCVVFTNVFNVTITILSIFVLFVLLSYFLGVSNELKTWKENIQKLEKS
jgi:UDP-GlcNAc:undecaprenyl-phosphate GlcNAc-1-phosphate transferase